MYHVAIKFNLYDKGIVAIDKKENSINMAVNLFTTFIVLKIDEKSLNCQTLQHLFDKNNGKIRVTTVIRENDMPVIFNNCDTKGSVIEKVQNVQIEHSVFRKDC